MRDLPPPSIRVYPAVENQILSKDYALRIEGQSVPLYTAPVAKHYANRPIPLTGRYSFGTVDSNGPVEVSLTSSVELTSLSIRHLDGDLDPEWKGTNARFILPGPGSYLVERNGEGRQTLLMIFVNPLIDPLPSETDPNVIFFGPGYHSVGLIEVSSGQTLYIDGGAVVTGRVRAQGRNICITGSGILENEGEEYDGTHLLDIVDSEQVRIEGIKLRKNCRGWTLVPKNTEHLTLSYVGICGSYSHNDDGIDPVNCRHMHVHDCFVRTSDDCFAFKGMDSEERSNCEDILVERCMMWTDHCCTILMGDECRANYMRNLTVRNCYVPYLSYEDFPKKLLMLHACEEMVLENIRIENIRVEGQGQAHNYMEFACEYNQWTETETVGHIRDVYIQNVHLTGAPGKYILQFRGFDEEHKVEGIHFRNCTVNGVTLDESYPNLDVQGYTDRITFD